MEERAAAVVRQLRAEGDASIRAELGRRYGIHTDRAIGRSMARMKTIAKPLAPDHELAVALWECGFYEARTIAAHIDDPRRVGVEQMDQWCSDFDNWALVDTVCFTLFDKTPHAWSMVEPWASSDGEYTKRAGFALLWALALKRPALRPEVGALVRRLTAPDDPQSRRVARPIAKILDSLLSVTRLS